MNKSEQCRSSALYGRAETTETCLGKLQFVCGACTEYSAKVWSVQSAHEGTALLSRSLKLSAALRSKQRTDEHPWDYSLETCILFSTR